ncbi:granulocyte-macrophage colony-stimulating factor receptor subunit alpha-like isoform X2 [Tachyglossus aculeatus]|uniref:granulocyte-macrophage colony-stimulating factor receptor subunit alpha-like isoform X2 n=1 Tax=Tachyglossus aculeatus TaxID=9261 RepID=UPI0018F51AC2|nr:granulocyte-macrophage colony-stimulating factor receptor subunit alpha-like isoform X2 [Tachyglossus aculeatus]
MPGGLCWAVLLWAVGGLTSAQPAAEEEIIQNLMLLPRKVKLTWQSPTNITDATCAISQVGNFVTEDQPRKDTNLYYCIFENHRLCKGANFTVSVTTRQRSFTKQLFFNNKGREGSAAEDFTCVVYDIKFLNCSWTVGRKAPEDVQYHLYSQASRTDEERECLQYRDNACGIHVGCHYSNLSFFKRYNYFYVNGSSKEAEIQFYDTTSTMLDQIERYNPPRNIEVNCSKSNCLIQWEKTVTTLNPQSHEVAYQLDIQKKIQRDGESQGTFYHFPSYDERADYSLRIRVGNLRRPDVLWGPWSEPTKFGSGKQAGSPWLVWVPVVFGSLVFALGNLCLWKRFLGTQKFFPRIPRIKDNLNDFPFQSNQIIWEEFKQSPEQCEIESIRSVGE